MTKGDGASPLRTTRLRTSQALVDGGSDTWPTLQDLVCRRIADLATGMVLQLVSAEPSIRLDIPLWCVDAGHDLIEMIEDGTATRFFIRKG